MNQHPSRVGFGAAILVAALLLPPALRAAGQNASSAADKKPDEPPTHTVTRGSIKSKIQLDAVFEAVEMAPVKLQPKAWTDLTVVEAVPHGARVKKGDVLVKLETEKIEEQLAELEQDRPAAAIALELAQSELENLKQTTPLKLEAARRAQKRADEDYSYFVSTGRAQREKSIQFGVKSAEQRLENANEELAQLEKMYKADDLTEETEEIILRRQKFAVESAEYSLETMKLSAELNLKTSIPREHENLTSQVREQELALALAEQTLPKNLSKKRLDLEKLKRDQKKAEKKLVDLRKDLELLTVRAPMSGIVYYGACENGKWTTGGVVAKKLIPTGKLSPNEVFMTIVNPDKLVLKTTVAENQLSQLNAGLEGEAAPVAAPDKKLPARIEDLGYIPLPGGGFEATLSVQTDKGTRVMPGMNCKVSFGESQKADALQAPKEAVFTEGNQKHVFVLKDGKPEKRAVKTGEAEAKMVEILEGLAEGDKILLKKPE